MQPMKLDVRSLIKTQQRELLAIALGSVALTVMAANGSVIFFIGLFSLLAALFSAWSYWMSWLSKRPERLHPCSRGFAVFLGIPLITGISNILNFRQNAGIVVVSVISFMGVTAPAWRALATRLRDRWRTHSFGLDLAGVALVALFAVTAFFKRAAFLSRGLPYEYYWDEPFGIGSGMRMLRDQTLNPHFFDYPSFISYFHLVSAHIAYAILKSHHQIQSPAEIITMWDTAYMWTITHSLFWYVARLMTVLYSCLGVGVLFWVGKRLGGFWCGLFAMALLSLSGSHSDLSAWIMVDPLTTTNACLWALAFMAVEAQPTTVLKRRTYAATCVLAGVLISTKYNTVPVLVPTALLPFWDADLRLQRSAKDWLLYGLTFIAVGFFAVTPYALFDFGDWLARATFMFRVYSQPNFNQMGNELFSQRFLHNVSFLKQSIPFGGLALGCTAALLVLGQIRPRIASRSASAFALLLVFPVLYLLLMSKMRVLFDRNLLAIIPFLSLSLAYAVALVLRETVGRFDRRWGGRTLTHVAGAALLVYAFFIPVRETFATFPGWSLQGTDTRTTVMARLRARVKAEVSSKRSWIVEEARIHREETGEFQALFEFMSAEEALRRWKAGDRPVYLVTADLSGYTTAALSANKDLLRLGQVIDSEGDRPVEATVYVSTPKVYVVKP